MGKCSPTGIRRRFVIRPARARIGAGGRRWLEGDLLDQTDPVIGVQFVRAEGGDDLEHNVGKAADVQDVVAFRSLRRGVAKAGLVLSGQTRLRGSSSW